MSRDQTPSDPHEPRSETTPEAFLPRVSPVGILEYPANDSGTVQERSRGLRLGAWVLLIFFALATVTTSIVSIGAYCLTSHGADTRALQESPWLDSRSPSEDSAPQSAATDEPRREHQTQGVDQ